jgi:hypothetical protein
MGEARARAQKDADDWMCTVLEDSPGEAHQAIKEPQTWTPALAKLEGGVVTADPSEVLRAAAIEWAGHWQAEGQEPSVHELSWGHELEQAAEQEPPLPLLSTEEIRESSRSFPASTSESLDGFHVRHYALLSEPALRVLAVLLQVAERTGLWPTAVRAMLIALLEKVAGGHRPIALLTSFFRMWARCRQPMAAEWESANDREYWAASRGRSAADAVWRAAADAEAQVAQESSAGTVLFDMVKFFDRITFPELVQRAKRLGFNMRILRACLRMYLAPRFMTSAGLATPGPSARRGIPAGCIFAIFASCTTLARGAESHRPRSIGEARRAE